MIKCVFRSYLWPEQWWNVIYFGKGKSHPEFMNKGLTDFWRPCGHIMLEMLVLGMEINLISVGFFYFRVTDLSWFFVIFVSM